MKKSVKALSVILILAALFGLAGGGYALKDVMECKSYWEAKGEESDANLSMLEDGLNTLKENEAAYIDGKGNYEQGLKEYEAGKKDLEAGRKEYEAGLKTLEEKQAEYDEGLATLLAAEQKLTAGQAAYDAGIQEYEAGKAQVEKYEASAKMLALLGTSLTAANGGLSDYNTINTAMSSPAFQQLAADALTAQQAAQVFSQKWQVDPSDSAAVEAKVASMVNQEAVAQVVVQKIMQNYSEAITNIMTENNLSQEDAVKLWMSQNENIVNQYKQEAIQAQVAALPISADIADLQAKNAKLNSEQNLQLVASAQATLQSLSSNMSTAINGFSTLAPDKAESFAAMSPVLTAINACANAPDIASFLSAAQALQSSNAGDSLSNLQPMLEEYQGVYESGMKELKASTPAYEAGKAKLPEAEKQLAVAKAELNAGYTEYYAGKEKLADGKVQLEEGKKTLEAAEKTIAEGEKTLAEAEKQLSEGKAQLDEFEAGRDQVMDGLDTLLATETYAGLVSVADRLGSDYTYMKNDTDLDIGRGLEALAAAREFSAENNAAVTKELTTRAVAAVLALLGSAVALIAGIMGLAAKVKGSGVLAVIAAVAAAAAVVAAFAAGSELSAVAGSTVASLALAAGVVVTVVAVVHAAVALSPAKAPAAE